jgi:hypothetical protein
MSRIYGPPLLTETSTLIAAMSVPPSAGRARLYDNLIRKLKNGGVWTQLDFLYIMAAHDEQAGRVELKSPGTRTLSYEGTLAAGDHTTDRGFTGDGSGEYLATAFEPSTHAVAMTQDDATVGSWSVVTNTGGAGFDIGQIPADVMRINPRTGADLVACRLNTTTNDNPISGSTDSRVHTAIVRTGAATGTAYRFTDFSTSTTGDYDVTSTGLGTLPVTFMRDGSVYSTRTIAVGYAGGALDATEIGVMDTALREYLTTVGAI